MKNAQKIVKTHVWASGPRLWWLIAGLALLILVGSGGVLTAAHLEEDDTFCAACHTQPESTFLERSQATAVDLASWHHGSKATRCIDCHSGMGVVGRADAMRIGAGDLLAYVSGRAQQPAVLTNPIPDVNCLKCHGEIPNTQNFQLHFHKFLPKWQAADKTAATCVACHAAHTTDGQTELGYLQEARTVQVCQRCHAFANVR